ncbi:hypothetical protein CBW52_15580 [Yersinia kristensenii]|uniref:Uncharacterized protein n=1 Tax=Yersinia kristensenii TaxID=28152 RepID=A0AB73QK30_YERKR|nr:hypothetical protein CBW52_15580 [Yersinia kristensenii]OWF86585.1 hypothetical protein B4907_00075 [Yersinia kristensenii]PEH53764.1 hypothetical protein CRM81_10775 [Yersinia kristensenii]
MYSYNYLDENPLSVANNSIPHITGTAVSLRLYTRHPSNCMCVDCPLFTRIMGFTRLLPSCNSNYLRYRQ